RNVLVQFDAGTSSSAVIVERLREVEPPADGAPPEPPAAAVIQERKPHGRRARIPVRGLDRDPSLARRVVDRLHRFPGVKASANPLTSRVLVEFDEHRVELDELLAEVLEVELPPLPGEDTPSHPLDPGPLIQSAARAAGAAV